MARATKGLGNADKWKTATDAERMRIGERIEWSRERFVFRLFALGFRDISRFILPV